MRDPQRGDQLLGVVAATNQSAGPPMRKLV
jgi:hypothetical protein